MKPIFCLGFPFYSEDAFNSIRDSLQSLKVDYHVVIYTSDKIETKLLSINDVEEYELEKLQQIVLHKLNEHQNNT